MLRSLRLAVPLAAALALAGCGVYSAQEARVDESLQYVAVLFLENQTAEPDLGVILSQNLITGLQMDNTLKVVGENDASSVISGQVVQYRLREVGTQKDLTINEYQVQIAVSLTFEVRATGEKIFAGKRFGGTGNYVLDDPAGTSEESARQEAMDEIVKGILAEIAEDW